MSLDTHELRFPEPLPTSKKRGICASTNIKVETLPGVDGKWFPSETTSMNAWVNE